MQAYSPHEVPTVPVERAIYNALRTPPNTIAGRPNAGNLAIPFIHQNRVLPAAVLKSYCTNAIRNFLPDLAFVVEVLPDVPGGGLQRVRVHYEV